MFEHIVLGAIQGITEWVPVSSEGMIILAKTYFFHSQEPLNVLISYALILHLGTFFAALIYFWKDIVSVFKALPSLCPCASKQACTTGSSDASKLLVFLFLTTLISGGLGILVVKAFTGLVYRAPQATTAITLLIALCLIITGFLQFKAPSHGKRLDKDLKPLDGVLLGLVQGLTTLPGLSRSGTTIAFLLLRNFDKKEALRLSFLMSMPLILLGNIIMNYKELVMISDIWLGVLTAFIVGLISINMFMKITEKINFGLFLMIIGGFMTLSVLLQKLFHI